MSLKEVNRLSLLAFEERRFFGLLFSNWPESEKAALWLEQSISLDLSLSNMEGVLSFLSLSLI